MSRVRALMAMVALPLAAALAAVAPACGRPCRQVTTTPVELECEPGAVFTGELHLDDAAVFESFLALECIPSASPDQVAAIVGSVDFLQDVVFVAVGTRAMQSRCIESRAAASVSACDDGLRVAFNDHLTGEPACVGLWTVAFALAREDMRAALGTDEPVAF